MDFLDLFSNKKRIYLDYASATPVCEEALRAMRDAESLVGNPGAIHTEGVEARRALEAARAHIAHELACKPREVVFTSGLTEANNLGLIGLARALERQKRTLEGTHWVVSAIEHPAVLESFAEIERMGGEVTHITPDARGIITVEALLKVVRPETVLVSIAWMNNEIGIIQPLREITQALREKYEHVLVHSDAGQAPLSQVPHVHTLGVDLMSFGSNKLYGPHGSGVLFIGNRVMLAPVILGGKQERGLRAGTENVALAAGCAAAFKKTSHVRREESERVRVLRDVLADGFKKEVPQHVVNGDMRHIAPHVLNVSVPNVSSEYVTLALDRAGIAISTKSACREGEESRSHVVTSLGGPEWRSQNTFRFSLGRETTAREVARTIRAFKEALQIPRA